MSAFGFVRYLESGASRLGVTRDGLVTPLDAVLPQYAGADIHSLWTKWDAVVDELDAKAIVDGLPLDDLDLLPSAVPQQVFQAGANYRQHVIELSLAQQPAGASDDPEERRARAVERVERRIQDGLPYVFIGLPSALTGSGQPVEVPGEDEQPDWELELAVVLAHGGYRVSEADAMALVAGYTIANDLTLRAKVYRPDMAAIGSDWLSAKNPPGFTPLGPVLVPKRYVPDPGSLRLSLRLNGELMQDSSADDMMFGIARLISYVSQAAMLLPGDVLLTGSPSGNGIHHGRLLHSGDLLESEITGLGVQRTPIVGRD